MTKKLIPGLAAVILLAGTVLFIINKNSAANSVHDFETAFKESPFYNGKEIKQVTDKVFSEVHPDLYGFTCDDEYVYWMNADGKVACITSTQQTFPEQDKDAFTRFDAEAAAGADLVLCGHTHAGQFIPIDHVGEWIGENDLRYGHEKRQDTDFIVTSGISNWTFKFKTAACSEFVVIDLMALDKE